MDLKQLFKRGALLAAANWQVVAIQFVVETTFYALLAVPVIGAAILVAVLLGGNLGDLLQGGPRDIFTAVASALMSEPVAFVSFIVAFSVVLFGGLALMFVVKGGTVAAMLDANAAAGPVEREPLTLNTLRSASAFTLPRFMDACARLHRRYLLLGLALTIVYGLSGLTYLAFVLYGYRLVEGRALLVGWVMTAAMSTAGLVGWITLVNLLYLLMQVAIAADDRGLGEAARAVARFIRQEFRELAGVFLVVCVLLVAATFASFLAWSGVGLIAFVPLVGLAVFPLQLAALALRGFIFQYVGLAALGAYVTLYANHRRSPITVARTTAAPASASAEA